MLRDLEAIVKEAGKKLKEGFYSKKDVTLKGEIDLVTQYDVKVEEILKEKIAEKFPEFEIIAEESSSGKSTKEKRVYIDPIDGTTNFVHSFPFTAISVGFYDGDSPVLASVYNPILDELFISEKEKGAFLNNKKLSVSSTKDLKSSLIATGFPYAVLNKDIREDILKKLDSILTNTQGVRRAGSAAIDMSYTARGSFDGYYEGNLSPWDLAAGVLLVEESGGVVTNLEGNKYNIESKETIVASNGFLHKDFLKILN